MFDYILCVQVLLRLRAVPPLAVRIVDMLAPANLSPETRAGLLLLLAGNAAGDTRIPLHPEALQQYWERWWMRIISSRPTAADESPDTARKTAAVAAQFPAALAVFAAEIVSGQYPDFIQTVTAETSIFNRPFIAAADMPGGFHFFYTQKLFTAAHTLSKRLPQLFPAVPDDGKHTAAAAPSGVVLDPAQTAAVNRGLRQPGLIVTGGPGTGKTTVVFYILRGLLAQDKTLTPQDIFLAAPSGKAAARLQESMAQNLARSAAKNPAEMADAREKTLGTLTGQTLHRLLGYDPHTGNFRYNADYPLSGRVFVIDEAGMISLDLFAALFAAIPAAAKVIILGDENQLPSVDAGAVFSALLKKMPDGQTVRLTRSYRSQQRILDLAETVNRGDAAGAAAILHAFTAAPREHWAAVLSREIYWLPAGETNAHEDKAAAELEQKVRSWSRHHYQNQEQSRRVTMLGELLNTAFADGLPAFPWTVPPEMDTLREMCAATLAGLNAGRILAMEREGMRGVEHLNAIAAAQLGGTPRNPLPPGAPLLITRNLYAYGLFNGDTGVVIADTGGTPYCVFAMGGDFTVFPLDYFAADEREMCFALTVHKAQGSEFDHVLLMLPAVCPHPLLTREILYTGITRARRSCGVYGAEEVFAAGTANKIVRETGI